MPRIQYFSSIDDLVNRLCKITSYELAAISEAMKRYNRTYRRELANKWKQILRMVAENSVNKPH